MTNNKLLVSLVFTSSMFIAGCKLEEKSEQYLAVCSISSFIASSYFDSLKASTNQISLIDTIYLRTLNHFSGDRQKTLQALIWVLIPYNEIPIRIPILHIKLKIPLPTAPEPLFTKKNNNLPAHFFLDSPNGSNSDKDKLAHFFGSAFLSYSFIIFDFSKEIGYFVEVFEETFQVDAKIDKRDLRMNDFGAEFGRRLKANQYELPSETLKLIKKLD